MAAQVEINLEQRLKAALEGYHRREFSSLRQAAEALEVPRTTLTRRHNGTKNRREGAEHRQLLTGKEEKEMIDWLMEMFERNIPARVGMLNGMAGTIIEARQLSS
ncbi:MAG: hypothetical protein M1823_006006, partial [Watsoniomyces obsoletus]